MYYFAHWERIAKIIFWLGSKKDIEVYENTNKREIKRLRIDEEKDVLATHKHELVMERLLVIDIKMYVLETVIPHNWLYF